MSQNPNSKLSNSGIDFTPTVHHDTYDFIKPEQFNLSGRAVLITGASKGVGRATATSFARAGAAQIALGARGSLDATKNEVLEAAQAAGRKTPQVLTLNLDVKSAQSVQDAVAEVTKAFARLDILVNNAGFLETFQPIGESKIEEWWQTWEVNVRGVYLMTRAFLPLLLKDGMKTILNVSSVGGNIISPGASSYQSGKLAVQRFTEFTDAEYGKQGILVFSIHPGGVPTELALTMPKEKHAGLVDTPQLSGDAFVWYTAERREWLAGRYVAVNWDGQELLKKREKIIRDDLLKVRLDVGLE